MINKQEVIDKLSRNKHKLTAYQVKELYLFGSVARNEAGSGSDVDFIVDFEPGSEVGFFKLVRLQKMLSEILDYELYASRTYQLSSYKYQSEPLT